LSQSEKQQKILGEKIEELSAQLIEVRLANKETAFEVSQYKHEAQAKAALQEEAAKAGQKVAQLQSELEALSTALQQQRQTVSEHEQQEAALRIQTKALQSKLFLAQKRNSDKDAALNALQSRLNALQSRLNASEQQAAHVAASLAAAQTDRETEAAAREKAAVALDQLQRQRDAARAELQALRSELSAAHQAATEAALDRVLAEQAAEQTAEQTAGQTAEETAEPVTQGMLDSLENAAIKVLQNKEAQLYKELEEQTRRAVSEKEALVASHEAEMARKEDAHVLALVELRQELQQQQPSDPQGHPDLQDQLYREIEAQEKRRDTEIEQLLTKHEDQVRLFAICTRWLAGS